MLRDRSPQRSTEGGVGAERNQQGVEHSMTSPYKGGSSLAHTARYLTDEQVGARPKKSMSPEVQR